MVVNLLIILTKLQVNGNLNGWISNNTSSINPFTSGRLGGIQGGGPNVIGIICADICFSLYIQNFKFR